MKKILFVFLAFVLSFSLVACKKEKDKNDFTKKEEANLSELKLNLDEYVPVDKVDKKNAVDYTVTVDLVVDMLTGEGTELEGTATVDFKANKLAFEKLSELEAYAKLTLDVDIQGNESIGAILNNTFEVYLKNSVIYASIPAAVLDAGEGNMVMSVNLAQLIPAALEALNTIADETSVPAGIVSGIVGDFDPENINEVKNPFEGIESLNVTNILKAFKEALPELYGKLEKAGLNDEFVAKLVALETSLIPALKKEDGKFVLKVTNDTLKADVETLCKFIIDNKETIKNIASAAVLELGSEDVIDDIEDDDINELKAELLDYLKNLDIKDFTFKFGVDNKGYITSVDGALDATLESEYELYWEEITCPTYNNVKANIHLNKGSDKTTFKLDFSNREYCEFEGHEYDESSTFALEALLEKITDGAKGTVSFSIKSDDKVLYAGELEASWTQTDKKETAALSFELEDVLTASLELEIVNNGITPEFNFDTTTAMDMTGTVLSLLGVDK